MAAPVRPPATTEADVKNAVSIRADVQLEYIQLPSILARWGSERVALAKAQRLAELDLEVVKASAKKTAKEARLAEVEAAGKDSKLKPLSEDAADDAVTLSAEYRQARLRVIDATERKEQAQVMVDAVAAKKDMLVSLGADLRAEKEADPSIRDRRPR